MDKKLFEKASQSEREFYQAKMRKANEAILEEIRKALNKLFELTAFPPAYKNFPGDIDYKTFVEKLGPALEQKAPFGFLWAIEDSDAEKSLSEIEDKKSLPPDIFRIGHLFLSPAYDPPEEVGEILLHLVCLYMWYKADADIQSYFITTHLSLAFGKLLAAVSKLETISIMKAERELTRIKRSTKAKKEGNDKRKGFIIAIYEHGKAIEAGTKFNMACTIIRKQFEDSRGSKGPWGTIPMDPKEMPTPSIDTIDRWLKGEGIRNRDFKKEGWFWIRQM